MTCRFADRSYSVEKADGVHVLTMQLVEGQPAASIETCDNIAACCYPGS